MKIIVTDYDNSLLGIIKPKNNTFEVVENLSDKNNKYIINTYINKFLNHGK